jgi:mRNA interferase RelE/StbE
MYTVIFSEVARKELRKVPRDVQQRVIKALERIRIRPEAFVIKLVGDPGYKLRVGDYRIILDIDKCELLVLVIKVGHRSGIYKQLPADRQRPERASSPCFS